MDRPWRDDPLAWNARTRLEGELFYTDGCMLISLVASGSRLSETIWRNKEKSRRDAHVEHDGD